MSSYWGADIGGTSTKLGRIDGREFEMVAVLPTPADSPPRALLQRLTEEILDYDSHPEGLGVGVAGLVEIERGLLLTSPNMPAWVNVPVRETLRSLLSCPIVVHNDANTFAYGAVARKEIPSEGVWLLITLGTGIGGTIVHDGRIIFGKGFAGEFGHMSVKAHGLPCPCGSKGCWERYASKDAIISYYREISGTDDQPDPREIADRARRGEQPAIEAFDRLGYWIGVGLANLGWCFSPHGFVLAGGLAPNLDLFESSCRETYRQRCPLDLDISRLKLASDAGALGAALLVRDEDQ
ncbi:ROK family protein [Candidatus Fermentibacteria bacterium]|nr:ROK family protein [Candidatus Fermentibacteria bacterium]